VQAIEHRGADHDGGAMLVVVEDRDLHALAQLLLDVEALGRLDVLEIDAAEGGLEGGDHVDQLVGVGLVDLEVEDVDAGELLEQHALAFHHRLGGERADVAQAEHRGAVGDHADQVRARGQLGRLRRILDDRIAGRGHARRVGQRQVALVGEHLGGRDRDLARARIAVIVERCRADQFVHACLPLSSGDVLGLERRCRRISAEGYRGTTNYRITKSKFAM